MFLSWRPLDSDAENISFRLVPLSGDYDSQQVDVAVRTVGCSYPARLGK